MGCFFCKHTTDKTVEQSDELNITYSGNNILENELNQVIETDKPNDEINIENNENTEEITAMSYFDISKIFNNTNNFVLAPFNIQQDTQDTTSIYCFDLPLTQTIITNPIDLEKNIVNDSNDSNDSNNLETSAE